MLNTSAVQVLEKNEQKDLEVDPETNFLVTTGD